MILLMGLGLEGTLGKEVHSHSLGAEHSSKEKIEKTTRSQSHDLDERDLSEPADAVLIREKEWKWKRYLKDLMQLPQWVDLGVEHRTRFEVYDHPWRNIQPLGRTDPQIQQRTRVRFGLNGETFRFLFEGQDPEEAGWTRWYPISAGVKTQDLKGQALYRKKTGQMQAPCLAFVPSKGTG